MSDAAAPIVLHVDDDRVSRHATSRILSMAGFVVWEAATGQEGLDKSLQGPDLVLLDVNLPDISGIEVCRRLKSAPATRHLPVLHLSAAHIRPEDRAAGLDHGADGYLVHPVHPRELCAEIRALLRLKDTEKRLRASEAWYRATLQSIGDGVIATDTAGRITLLNATASALTGWTPEAACGRPLEAVFRIVNEQTRQPAENPVARVLREGRVVGLANHTVLLARDGTEYAIADAAAPVQDDGGATSGVVLIFRDQTAERAARRALEEKERLLSESQRIAHIGGWVADLAGHITWTEETYRIYGVHPASFVPARETLLGLVHPEDRPAMEAWIEACVAGRKAGELEFRAVRPDGSIRHLCSRGELVADAENRPSFTAGTVQDITERKLAELQSAERMAELQRWYEATLGREGRVLELKREVNQLLAQLGQPPRYASALEGGSGREGE